MRTQGLGWRAAKSAATKRAKTQMLVSSPEGPASLQTRRSRRKAFHVLAFEGRHYRFDAVPNQPIMWTEGCREGVEPS
jgi:hypothetical protein